MTATTTVGLGAGDLATSDVVLDLGTQHPSTHGMLQLSLTVDGDRIVQAEPLVGFLHRGHEKLYEVRDYRQILMLSNRYEWLSSYCNEVGVCLAVERMLGLEVPARARWIRTLLCELQRVLNALMFLGSYPPEIASIDVGPAAFRAREALHGLLEEATGGRVHPMYSRIGGLYEDLPAGWSDRCRTVVATVRDALGPITALISEDEAFRSATRGVGVLARADVDDFGVSGPVARASGADLDLRRDEPYLSYDELDVTVVTRTEGDALARYECLLDQVPVSLGLVEQCLDRLPGGPVNVRLPKVLRVPEGHTYAWTENPLGLNGYYLVSRGDKTPWRLKMRTASFNNVSVLPRILAGARVADLAPILGSMFFVIGDIDK